MPKIPKSDEKVRLALLSGTIRKRMDALGVTDKQMALCVGVAEGTFIQKKNNPERFKYTEVAKVAQKLKFTDEEKLEIL